MPGRASALTGRPGPSIPPDPGAAWAPPVSRRRVPHQVRGRPSSPVDGRRGGDEAGGGHDERRSGPPAPAEEDGTMEARTVAPLKATGGTSWRCRHPVSPAGERGLQLGGRATPNVRPKEDGDHGGHGATAPRQLRLSRGSTSSTTRALRSLSESQPRRTSRHEHAHGEPGSWGRHHDRRRWPDAVPTTPSTGSQGASSAHTSTVRPLAE